MAALVARHRAVDHVGGRALGAWIEANRTLSYLATMVAGVALVRLFPQRWAALLGGVVLASVIVCGYALLTKVFPGALNPDEIYARLREPFGYWNAVGLMAAAAGPACLWLGARRSGHAAFSALAYPALGLLVVALLLAYSRGALLALACGCALWFAIVPLRLRGVAVLATSAFCGGLVAFWAFAQNPLSTDNVPLAERASAGHELGIALAAMVLVLLAAGLAIGFASAQRAPSLDARRQAGVIVVLVLALVPVALVGALALSSRGLGGSLSNGWKNLTDPHATATISNAPDRLTAVGSVRARYWNEALKIAKAHKALGVGAGGYATVRPRYPQRHARRAPRPRLRRADAGRPRAGRHGRVARPAGGVAGRGLAHRRAVGRARGARRGRPSAWGWPRCLAICVVFGVHSFVDWTWFVPGNAVLALLCAGWLAGRGPDRRSRSHGARRRAWPCASRGGSGWRWPPSPSPWWPRGRRGSPSARSPRAPTRSATAEAGNFAQARSADRPRRADQPAVGRPALPAGGDRARRRQHGRRAQRAAGGGAQAARQPGDVAGAGRVRAQPGRASRRRSRPSARPSTSTRARRRRSAIYLQASGRQ